MNIEKLQAKFLAAMADHIELPDMDEHEAECIIYGWLLKTKLYMMGETSREWSGTSKAMLTDQVDGIVEMLPKE